MRFCISLPMSLEGEGTVCWIPCRAEISAEEVQDWSFSWGSLLASRFAQTPGPVIHMIWGVGVGISSGKIFTVLCPPVHRAAPYLCRAVSPDHSNSHCSFERSLHIWCVSWCRAEVPMISSIRRLRMRECLVAVAKEMPGPWGGIGLPLLVSFLPLMCKAILA